MNNFTENVKRKFLKTAEKYGMFLDADNVVVGFSGGADSVCLLHLLNSFKDFFNINLIAVHINHGIRGEEALRDAEFAKSFCDKYGITFYLHNADCIALSKERGETLEECGRRVRYECFNSHCTDYSKIATAHNANDNAETVILNLTRGASLKGICGIPPVRDNIVRPLINCSRTEIEGYCDENQLMFVTDSTNLCDDYTRNKIRHSVLPVLSQINPAFVDAVGSFTQSVSDSYSYISAEAEKALKLSEIEEEVYNAEYLTTLNKAVTCQALVTAYDKLGKKTLDSKKINGLYELLRKGGRLQLFGNTFAEVKKGKLRFYENESSDFSREIEIDKIPFVADFGSYCINISKYVNNCSKKVHHLVLDNLIDCDKIDGKIFLRTRRSGDEFSFSKRKITKTLKKLFNETDVPIEKRNKIPVLCDESGVVWVYGFGVNARCRVSEESVNIILVRGNDK